MPVIMATSANTKDNSKRSVFLKYRFRKETSILRTETFGSPKDKTTHSRKGRQPRPGRFWLTHWGNLCKELRRHLLYRLGPAGGIPSLTDKAHHKSKMNEWTTECATHIFPSKNRNSRTLKTSCNKSLCKTCCNTCWKTRYKTSCYTSCYTSCQTSCRTSCKTS